MIPEVYLNIKCVYLCMYAVMTILISEAFYLYLLNVFINTLAHHIPLSVSSMLIHTELGVSVEADSLSFGIEISFACLSPSPDLRDRFCYRWNIWVCVVVVDDI